MTTRAAIDGEYSDFKIVKTRSVAQMIIEVDIAKGDELVRLFGLPVPGKPVRVAVARLAETPQIEAKAEAPANGRRTWRELTPTQQAAIRCAEPAFQRFLREEGESKVSDEAGAAAYVRLICGIRSRKELANDNTAAAFWDALEHRYQAWLSAPQAVG